MKAWGPLGVREGECSPPPLPSSGTSLPPPPPPPPPSVSRMPRASSPVRPAAPPSEGPPETVGEGDTEAEVLGAVCAVLSVACASGPDSHKTTRLSEILPGAPPSVQACFAGQGWDAQGRRFLGPPAWEPAIRRPSALRQRDASRYARAPDVPPRDPEVACATPTPGATRDDAAGAEGSDAPDIFAAPEATPVARDADGVWVLSEYDVHCLAVGCGVLGSGGGGSTYKGFLSLKRMVQEGALIRVYGPDQVPAGSQVRAFGRAWPVLVPGGIVPRDYYFGESPSVRLLW